MTEPVETYDDGGALYEAGPFEVAAQSPGVNPGVVTIDGRTVTPHTARQLARVLETAADRAQGQPTAELDPVRAEVRRRMYAVAASWRVSPPETNTVVGKDTEATWHTWRQVAEDVEAWADAPDHLVPDLPERPTDLDPTYRTQES